MKKFYIASVFVFLSAIGGSSTAFGQKGEPTSDDIVILAGKSERRLDNASYRGVMTVEWFNQRGGDVFTASRETFVAAQPDRFQWISENGATRIETIVIGEDMYRRTGDGDWETVATSRARRGDPSAARFFGDLAGGAKFPTGTGKFVSRGTIDGQDVWMYELRNDRMDTKTGEIVRTDTTQYWINKDGMIVRKIIDQDFAGEKRFCRSTTNYVYGDIRVDEPTVPVKTEDK